IRRALNHLAVKAHLRGDELKSALDPVLPEAEYLGDGRHRWCGGFLKSIAVGSAKDDRPPLFDPFDSPRRTLARLVLRHGLRQTGEAAHGHGEGAGGGNDLSGVNFHNDLSLSWFC